jgi:predicted dehydrogenase
MLAERLAATGRAEVVAVYGPNPAKAEALAAPHGARVVEDFEAAVTADDVDAAVIAGPPSTHAAQVIAACGAGKHVFCEKPLAISTADADACLAAAAGAGGPKLFVGHVLRLHPAFQALKQAVDDGVVGAVRSVRVVRVGDAAGTFGAGWRSRRETTGGVLLEINVHELDMLRWLVGEPSSVFATGTSVRGITDYEEVVDVALSFAGGATANLHSSLACAFPEHGVVVSGVEGTLVLNHDGVRWKRFDSSDAEAIIVAVPAAGDLIAQEVDAFLAWVLDDVPPFVTAWDARMAVAMADAANRSIASGQPSPV